MRSAFNCIFIWAIDNRRVKNILDGPAKGISIGYKKREKKPEVYSISEQRQLLDAAQNLNHPWYPVWAVALSTGMRNGELYALRWEKVDLENAFILVEEAYKTKERVIGSTKARYFRQIPTNKNLERFLKHLQKKTGNTPFMLPRLAKWDKGE